MLSDDDVLVLIEHNDGSEYQAMVTLVVAVDVTVNDIRDALEQYVWARLNGSIHWNTDPVYSDDDIDTCVNIQEVANYVTKMIKSSARSGNVKSRNIADMMSPPPGCDDQLEAAQLRVRTLPPAIIKRVGVRRK